METAAQIRPSSSEDIDFVIEQLKQFNANCLSLPRNDYLTPLQFHFRTQDDTIIAGINAALIAKSTVFVSILWVDEQHRGKDYGSKLLQHVETEARKHGARMIHLDTLDFQARDFYAKYGYEVYPTLEDSPSSGHCRYYMSKPL